MFDGFRREFINTGEVEIHAVIGGDGPPLLLLHGFPQNHVMWHRIAPALAEHYTVVATDLRGYGDSSKPPGDPAHETYAKRSMAADQMAVMTALGFDRFRLVGHDRGARVAHRLCLDYPEAVERVALLDIVPTLTVFETVNQELATAYYHWFFLIQTGGLPEHLIGLDPEGYLRHTITSWGSGPDAFSDAAMAQYLRCFCDPAAIHAACEDYRAAASIDLEDDRADRDARIACPVLVLWGLKGVMERVYDVVATWQEKADDVRGHGLDCGHFLAEEKPEETLQALTPFLAA